MIIYRKTVKELLLYLTIVTLGLNLILMMEKILKLSRIGGVVRISLKDITLIILLIQPQILIFSLPLGLLLAATMVYGRMNFDNEIMVLRAAGLSLKRLFVPLFSVALFCLILSFFVSLYAAPVSLKKLRVYINTLLSERALDAIEPGVFFRAFKGITLFVNDKNKKGQLKGIFIFRDMKNSPQVITASEATILQAADGQPVFVLKNGLIHMASKNTLEIHFKQYSMKLPFTEQILTKRRGELFIDELFQKVITDESPSKYTIEFFRRFTFPLLVVPVVLLACPLSLSSEGNRLKGLLLALVIYAVYYTVLVYSENLYRTGRTGYIACVIPYVCFLVVSGVYFRKGLNE